MSTFRNRILIAAAIVFGLSLVGSVVIYAGRSARFVEVVAWFPGIFDENLAPERRVVPRRRNAEEQAEVLIQELLLGPVSFDRGQLVPEGSRVNAVLVRNGALYVSLSEVVVALADSGDLPLEQVIEAIERTIRSNLTGIDTVEITVGGNNPFFPPSPVRR